MRKYFKFIHIPKTGGTYLSQLLGKSNRHTPLTVRDMSQYNIFLAGVRHPLTFYRSFYYFLRGIEGPALSIREIANRVDLNTFIYIVTNSKRCRDYMIKHNIRSHPRGWFFIDMNNEYGLLTNYFLYLLNPYGYSDIDNVLKFIDDNVEIYHQETLDDDIEVFVRDNDIPIFNKMLGRRLNISTYPADSENIEEDMIELIKYVDAPIIEHFYPSD